MPHKPMRQFLLTTASAIGLTLGWTGIASAQTIIDGPSSAITITGEVVIITPSGSIVATSGLGGVVSTPGSAGNRIINNGSITTTSAITFGIRDQGTGSFIENNGTITTLANLGYGISVSGAGVTVVNNGFIFTSGASSHGIGFSVASATGTLTNRGAVRTQGINSIAANVEGAGHIFLNSGLLVAEHPSMAAINMDSAGGRLDLLPSSYIGGAITFTTAAQLNITTGQSHSVLWRLPLPGAMTGGAANISGSVPWFYNVATGEFATYDPTGLAGTYNQLGGTANLASRLAEIGLRRADRAPGDAPAPTNDEGSPALGFATHGADDGSGTSASATVQSAFSTFDPNSGPLARTPLPRYGIQTGSFWGGGFVDHSDQESDASTLDHDIEQHGFAAGYSWQHDPRTRLGLTAAYLEGQIHAASSFAEAQDIASEGAFVGVHGERDFGAATFGLGLTAGWQTHTSDRFINDNLALTGGLTLGESSAQASYDSWFVIPEAWVSTDFALPDPSFVITPTARIRYAFQSVNGFTETGANANATVDGYSLGLLEGSLELALSKRLDYATLTARAGGSLGDAFGGDGATVTLIGITNEVGIGDSERASLYLGATADFALADRASLILDGQATFSDGLEGYRGAARIAVSF